MRVSQRPPELQPPGCGSEPGNALGSVTAGPLPEMLNALPGSWPSDMTTVVFVVVDAAGIANDCDNEPPVVSVLAPS